MPSSARIEVGQSESTPLLDSGQVNAGTSGRSNSAWSLSALMPNIMSVTRDHVSPDTLSTARNEAFH